MNRAELTNLYLATLNSNGSKKKYGDIINKFLDSVDKDITGITGLDVSSYVFNAYSSLAPTTRNMRVNVLRSFSKWLAQNGVIKLDFAKGIKALNAESEPKDRLTKEDTTLMYAKGNAREKAIMSVLMNTGLRISEITNLKLADYNKAELHIKTKGSRYRTVYLSEGSKSDIDNYLAVRKSGSDYLFTSNTGAKLCEQSVNNSWTKLARRANIDKHITSHSFRRMVVTEVANEYGLAVAQKFIGHKNIATTARYYQADEDMIKNIFIGR